MPCTRLESHSPLTVPSFEGSFLFPSLELSDFPGLPVAFGFCSCVLTDLSARVNLPFLDLCAFLLHDILQVVNR